MVAAARAMMKLEWVVEVRGARRGGQRCMRHKVMGHGRRVPSWNAQSSNHPNGISHGLETPTMPVKMPRCIPGVGCHSMIELWKDRRARAEVTGGARRTHLFSYAVQCSARRRILPISKRRFSRG